MNIEAAYAAHPSEEALHEAIAVQRDSVLLFHLCPTLCGQKRNRVWATLMSWLTFLHGGSDTYSGQLSQAVLHYTDQVASCPGHASKTPAGASWKSPCVQ